MKNYVSQSVPRYVARLVSFGFIAGFVLCTAPAEAASILVDVNIKIGDGPGVSGDQTVATLRFDDFGADQVKLTVDSSLNAATEFLRDLAFNVKVPFVPSDLSASYVPGSQLGEFELPTLLKAGQNAQNPTGTTGGYDFNFVFATSNSQQGAKRFNLDDSFQYLFTAPGLTAADFDAASAASYYTYAKVHGSDGGGGGYGGGRPSSVPDPPDPPSSVPEPTSVLLLMIGAGAAIARARKA